MEEQDYSASAEMGEAYEQYQTALKEIFTNIRNGVLVSASESLLTVSDWLLSKVAELGAFPLPHTRVPTHTPPNKGARGGGGFGFCQGFTVDAILKR